MSIFCVKMFQNPGVYKVPKCPLRSGGKKGMKFPFCGNKVKKLSNFTIKKYFFEKKGKKVNFVFEMAQI